MRRQVYWCGLLGGVEESLGCGLVWSSLVYCWEQDTTFYRTSSREQQIFILGKDDDYSLIFLAWCLFESCKFIYLVSVVHHLPYISCYPEERTTKNKNKKIVVRKFVVIKLWCAQYRTAVVKYFHSLSFLSVAAWSLYFFRQLAHGMKEGDRKGGNGKDGSQ